MNKKTLYKLFYCVSAGLLLGFCIRTGADYYLLDPTASTPFYVILLTRVVTFLLPSAVAFIAACVLRKKYRE